MEVVSIGDLITHYEEKEPDPETSNPNDNEKAHSTKQGHRCYLEKWTRPRWGMLGLRDVRTVAVEGWLKALTLSDNHAMR